MPSVETIYQESVRPLAVGDQVRLTDMIMENVDVESQSTTIKRAVLDILADHPVKRVFKNPTEVDEWLRTERDSWDD